MKRKLPTKGHEGTRRGKDNPFLLRVPSCPFVGKSLFICIGISLLAGCNAAPTTQPLTEDQKQDAILNDPMNYKPAMEHDISGGSIGQSHGLGTDIDHVLNP